MGSDARWYARIPYLVPSLPCLPPAMTRCLCLPVEDLDEGGERVRVARRRQAADWAAPCPNSGHTQSRKETLVDDRDTVLVCERVFPLAHQHFLRKDCGLLTRPGDARRLH